MPRNYALKSHGELPDLTILHDFLQTRFFELPILQQTLFLSLFSNRPHDISVDDGGTQFGLNFQRISVKNSKVGIFTHRNASQSVIYSADPGCINGDGTQSTPLIPPFFGSKRRAQWQILNTRYRMICGQRHRDTRLLENPRRFKVGQTDLVFAAGCQ